MLYQVVVIVFLIYTVLYFVLLVKISQHLILYFLYVFQNI